ncbi:MAG: helix-turn-helix domain-containing protein [Pseudomonadota bacterium]
MEKDQPIRAITRALSILKTINRLDSPTLTEISRATDLPYPTTFRIVQTLISEGMIEQEPFRKRYRATEQVKALSFGFQEDDQLLKAASGPMQDFTAQYLWPVTLSVRVGNRMMIKHSTHQLTSQTFTNYHPGYTLPLLESASGRAHMAFCSDEERDTVLDGFKTRATERSAMSLELMTGSDLLTQIQSQGYAEYARTQHNATPGRTSAFAVPVIESGALRACITLVFFNKAHSMEDAVGRYLAPLQSLASTIGANVEAE